MDDGYQAYDEKEFFASLFTDYIRTGGKIAIPDDVYKYIKDIAELLD